MNAFLTRILWVIYGIVLLWYAYLFGSNYANCRADSTATVVCFFYALILSALEAIIFAVVSGFRFLASILP
ncbi:MAG TPA: hypothetical protein VKW08_18195 [Xanthobacteraceae bacterium]|nr:hypothetical protein [Xanthobacteraceae bacterium]